MTLHAPAWLALLLLAGPILLLHMRRRRRVVVPSLLLWEGLSGERRPSVALQRPPLSLPLLLQLLALLLVALLLARPALNVGAAHDHLVLLVDAGWQQRDETRHAAALAEVRRALGLQARRPGARVSLVAVAERPAPVAARWPAEATGLADLAPGLAPTDGAGDWERAGALAAALLEADERSRVLLIGASSSEAAAAEAALRAASAGPAGATAVEAAPLPAPPLVTITAARVTPGDRPGEWTLSGGLAAVGHEGAARVELAFHGAEPGHDRRATLDVSLAPADDGLLEGAFEARLQLDGAGALTLTPEGGGPPAAFVLAPDARQLPVLYVGPGNAPLTRALEALGHVELRSLPVPAGAPAELPTEAAGYGLVVLDRVRVAEPPLTSTLWLGAATTADAPAPQPREGLGVTHWRADHPLAARTDWGSLAPLAAWAAPLAPGAEALVSAEGATLLQARRLAHGLEVRVAFDIEASGWSATAGFPLFVRDLLELLAPDAGARVAPACHVGLACALPAGASRLSDPHGAEVPLPRLGYEGAEVVADAFVPGLAGVYRYATPQGEGLLAVNAFHRPEAAPDAVGAAGASAAAPSLRLVLLLVLAAVLVLEAWLARRQHGRAFGGARWLLRGAALALVVAAAFGPRLPLPALGGRLVVVAPGAPWGSGELPGWEGVAARLAALRGDGGRVVSVAGGDVQGALELAAAQVPAGTPLRLVLVGDGAETRGDLVAALARLAAAGTPVDALPLARAPRGEATLRALTPPAEVVAGDRFALQVEAHATSAGVATLRTYRDGELVDAREVELTPGANRFAVPVHEAEPGAVSYRAELALPGDAFAANDAASASVSVRPAGRVLLVAADPAWGAVSAAALASQGIAADVVAPAALPAGEALLSYDAVVLANVPAAALDHERLEQLEAAVAAHGRALLLLGGERAFGPGGYLETPLERLSPASSLVPREAPELALAFVIDRSNSMRQYAGDRVRLEIAKVAVLRAFELLPEGARAALIAFDSTARTLVPLASVTEAEAFAAAVAALEPRGGTAIHPGLVEAYEQLAGSGAAAKHVIVMSDGLSQPGDFEGVLAQLAAAGVTVSTIGIGPEADAAQLREIATLGGGTFHFSADFAALPGIMSHEVLLQSGELTAEGATVPAWRDRAAPFLRAWPDELPPVEGFVPTSLKPGARLHLAVTDEGGREVPLLASWRYGAGEVVAFTAHAAGPWTLGWLELEGYPLLWSHLLRQLARPAPEERSSLSVSARGDRLQVAWQAPDGREPPALTLERPDGSAVALSARAVGAGRYLAEALAAEPGAYAVTAGAEVAPAAFLRDYPAALDFGLADPERLAAAARATGGRVLTDLAAVGAPRAWHWRAAPAWPWLALAALALLLVELTLRYAPELLASRRKG